MDMNQIKAPPEALLKVKEAVGESHESKKGQALKERLVFCFFCGTDITEGNSKPGEPTYTDTINNECPYFGRPYERALIIDDRIKWQFYEAAKSQPNFNNPFGELPPSNGELVHFSVGMIIQRKIERHYEDGQRQLIKQVLLFRRTLHPIGKYTIPAGHLERGENTSQEILNAALREAYEETGLGILSPETVEEGLLLHEECRRGVDYHIWYLYRGEGIGDARMNYEADIMGWYTESEVSDLQARGLLTVPTAKFLTKGLLFA